MARGAHFPCPGGGPSSEAEDHLVGRLRTVVGEEDIVSLFLCQPLLLFTKGLQVAELPVLLGQLNVLLEGESERTIPYMREREHKRSILYMCLENNIISSTYKLHR